MARARVGVRRGAYVQTGFGPLYIVDSLRDSTGTVWCGINGRDGVNYQFNAHEVRRVLTRDEFDELLAGAESE